MRRLPHLFENNRRWAEAIEREEPGFFARLAHQQAPEYLWIGCSDSRVPANQIVGLDPGEVFVHRNVANVVLPSDLNCMAVLQFAVEALRVQHVIVCGHYGCGGVAAACRPDQLGLIDHWLAAIREVRRAHEAELDAIADTGARVDRLCELNVAQQVASVCRTTIVQNAWAAGRPLAVHGWIYGVADGRLRDLDLCVTGPDQVPPAFRTSQKRSE